MHTTVMMRIATIYFIDFSEVRVQLSIGQQECVGMKILNPVSRNPEIGIFEDDRSLEEASETTSNNKLELTLFRITNPSTSICYMRGTR